MPTLMKIRHLLSAPTFDDEDTNRIARLIHFILVMLVVTVVIFIVGIIFFAPKRLNRLPLTMIFLILPLIHLLILRQGYVKLTALSLSCSLWLAITLANFTGGGIHHPGYGAYIVIVGIVALLMGGRWALFFAGLSSIAGLAMILAENAGFIESQRSFSATEIWLLQTVYFIVAALLIHVAARNIYLALERAREQERLLKERNHQLEEEFVRREEAEKLTLELAREQERLEVFRQLISDLSHDLKTPLTVINTSLYLLERLDDPQRQKEKMRLIQKQTNRLSKLVHDILKLSQLDHLPELDQTLFDIKDILSELDDQFRAICENKSISLLIYLSANQTHIQGNKEEIRRAFLNLLENAVHYTPPGGSISVYARNINSDIVLEVVDTGIGISQADLPYIFDRFYRTDKARTTDGAGSGLGLAIVKRIVEIHAGEIVASSKEGVGTTIQVTLPTQFSEDHQVVL